MARTATVREQVKQFVHAKPFQPFVMILENGQKLLVEHPECIAFDPASTEGARGWDKLAVIPEGLVVFSTFSAVTTINTLDRGRRRASRFGFILSVGGGGSLKSTEFKGHEDEHD